MATAESFTAEEQFLFDNTLGDIYYTALKASDTPETARCYELSEDGFIDTALGTARYLAGEQGKFSRVESLRYIKVEIDRRRAEGER